MSHALSSRLGRIGLVAALLAGVLAVSFGTGYRASQAVLDSGSAYLTKGHTVVRVNGESRRVDAKLTGSVAKSQERLRVVELPDGQLYVENTATGARSKVDTTTMTPQALPKARPGGAGSLVGGGSETYSVDRATGAVGWFHPRTRQLTPVATLGPVQGVEVDSAGTAWVLAAGRLHPVHRTEQRPALAVGPAGEPALLTLVGNRPTVLRLAAGEAVRFGAGDVQRARVPELAGRSVEQVAVAAPGSGDTLWVASRQGLGLVGVDLASGQVRSVELSRRGQQVRNGPPVVAGGRVLVPDYKARVVHVVETASATEGKPIVEVPGTRDFDMTVRGSKVFINDQYAATGLVVDGDRAGKVDKGGGDGVDGPRKPDATDPDRRPERPDRPDRPDERDRPGAGRDQRPGGEPVRPVPAPTTPPPVAVPEVVGLDRQAACAALRAVRLDCVEVPVGNDGAGATGLVLRTAPAAGATVPVGQVVTVSYRGDIQLPDLLGLPSAAACAALEAAGLVCERDERPAVADAAAVDKVSAQDPAAGTPAGTGDRVRISYPTQVLVPDVRTLGVADACARLAAAGLACTQVDAGTRPAAEPPNTVVDQAPAGGVPAVPGSAVTVRFYGSVRVPVVTGADPASAQAAITAAGLTPVPVADAVTNQPNLVLSQTPVPDTAVAPGTQVQYAYEDVGPAQVRLGKKNGAFRYALQAQPDYVDQRLLGWGFAAPAGGTTAVYRYVCDGARCGGAGTFYYSMTNAPTAGAGWANNGIAFYAYATQLDPRLVPVRAMFDGTAWVWAVQGTPEHQEYLNRGYTRGEGFNLGWVWPPA